MFWHALSFLTILPTPSVEWLPGDLGRAARWFPTVGWVIGLLLMGGFVVAGQLLPPYVGAVLVVALWAGLTGALHLDGLADCGDGLLAAVSPERRLEIMKDSRVGTFGAVVLFLTLLLKVTAVAAQPVPLALLLAPVVGRWLILPLAQRPLARRKGLAASFALDIGPADWLVGGVWLLPLLIWGGLQAVAAVFVAAVVVWFLWRLAVRRLGGITGDVLGAAVELAEAAVLITMTASLSLGT